ncbi:MAG: DNA polymerase III subunit delta [Blastocatellia bacterium]
MKRTNPADALKSQAEFYREIKSGQIATMYLLEGGETYLRDRALQALIDHAVDEGLRDFNVTRIDVQQGNLDEALSIATQYPMMSRRRLVVVTGFEAINDDKVIELLKDYVRDPAPTTALTFVSSGLDNRRNIATILRKCCRVVGFDPLDEREAAPRWLNEYFSRAGCALDQGAAAYLIGMAGTDLRRLSMEADKLISYAGPAARVGRQDIDALVQYTREHSSFEITDAILDGHRRRALELTTRLFENGGEYEQTQALLLLGAIAGSFRRLLVAKELMAQNAAMSEISKAVGLPDFAVRKLNERARRHDLAAILHAISRIAATDIALKTSRATPRLLLEILICELCLPATPGTAGTARAPRLS